MERTPGAPAPPGCTPEPCAGKAGTGWKREIGAEEGNKRESCNSLGFNLALKRKFVHNRDLEQPPGWAREAGLVQLEQRYGSNSQMPERSGNGNSRACPLKMGSQ